MHSLKNRYRLHNLMLTIFHKIRQGGINMRNQSFSVRMTFAAIMLIATTSAHAVLVTDVWESTVINDVSGNNTVFAPGDKFTWTVTYDDTSLTMHEYDDGANGIAEFGTGDDTISNILCTGAASGSPGCTINYTTEYNLLADAIFDLSQFYLPMQSAGLTGYNGLTLNYAQRTRSDNGTNNARFWADDFSFAVAGVQTMFFDNNIGASNSTITTLSSVLISTNNVPEPPVIALIAIGLLGVGTSRLRKNIQKT